MAALAIYEVSVHPPELPRAVPACGASPGFDQPEQRGRTSSPSRTRTRCRGCARSPTPRTRAGPSTATPTPRKSTAPFRTARPSPRCVAGCRPSGFQPDLIVGHSGWGETLVRQRRVYPDVPLLANFEFYYHAQRGSMSVSIPSSSPIFNDPSRLRARNGINLLAFQAADWGHSATQLAARLEPLRDAIPDQRAARGRGYGDSSLPETVTAASNCL